MIVDLNFGITPTRVMAQPHRFGQLPRHLQMEQTQEPLVVAAGQGAAEPQRVQQSQDSVGEVWSASAQIIELDDTCMFMQLEDGSEAYV